MHIESDAQKIMSFVHAVYEKILKLFQIHHKRWNQKTFKIKLSTIKKQCESKI